jgi:hypothetical protein
LLNKATEFSFLVFSLVEYSASACLAYWSYRTTL